MKHIEVMRKWCKKIGIEIVDKWKKLLSHLSLKNWSHWSVYTVRGSIIKSMFWCYLKTSKNDFKAIIVAVWRFDCRQKDITQHLQSVWIIQWFLLTFLINFLQMKLLSPITTLRVYSSEFHDCFWREIFAMFWGNLSFIHVYFGIFP